MSDQGEDRGIAWKALSSMVRWFGTRIFETLRSWCENKRYARSSILLPNNYLLNVYFSPVLHIISSGKFVEVCNSIELTFIDKNMFSSTVEGEGNISHVSHVPWEKIPMVFYYNLLIWEFCLLFIVCEPTGATLYPPPPSGQ